RNGQGQALPLHQRRPLTRAAFLVLEAEFSILLCRQTEGNPKRRRRCALPAHSKLATVLCEDVSSMSLLRSPCDDGAMRARKPANTHCGRLQRRWTLAATILGSSMVFIDGTVVNVALPALQSSLDAN